MPSTRPTLYGSRHAVSAGHYLAAAAGFAILEAGGNAIDAGCAAGIALAVLHPDEVNVAGVAPIMIRTGQGKVVTIAGLGHWPRRFRPTCSCASMAARCRWASCAPSCRPRPTPGSPRSRDYGTMSFGDVAGAAVRYAREGFAVFEYMADHDQAVRGRLRAGRPTPRSSCPAASCPQVGDRFVQTDLAGTLQYMIDEERAASQARPAGRPRRRRAPPSIAATSPRRSCATTRRTAATSARDDLADFHSRYEAPVQRALARLRGLHLRAVVPGPDAGAGAAHGRGVGRARRAWRTTAPTTSISSPRS